MQDFSRILNSFPAGSSEHYICPQNYSSTFLEIGTTNWAFFLQHFYLLTLFVYLLVHMGSKFRPHLVTLEALICAYA